MAKKTPKKKLAKKAPRKQAAKKKSPRKQAAKKKSPQKKAPKKAPKKKAQQTAQRKKAQNKKAPRRSAPKRSAAPAVEMLAKVAIGQNATEAHLSAAQALVQEELLGRSGVLEEIEECRRAGYFHFWMAALQRLGKWLEDQNNDGLLPPSFWEHLVFAAEQMELTPFIPFFVGKAARRPKRDWYDVMVALVMLERMLPAALREKHAETAASLKTYVDWLEGLDGSHPALFRAPIDAEALRARFVDARYLETGDETMARINQGFTAMFNPLFSLVTDPDVPPELHDAAWSVINVNTFVIKLYGFTSAAEVWWRA